MPINMCNIRQSMTDDEAWQPSDRLRAGVYSSFRGHIRGIGPWEWTRALQKSMTKASKQEIDSEGADRVESMVGDDFERGDLGGIELGR